MLNLCAVQTVFLSCGKMGCLPQAFCLLVCSPSGNTVSVKLSWPSLLPSVATKAVSFLSSGTLLQLEISSALKGEPSWVFDNWATQTLLPSEGAGPTLPHQAIKCRVLLWSEQKSFAFGRPDTTLHASFGPLGLPNVSEWVFTSSFLLQSVWWNVLSRSSGPWPVEESEQ